MTNALRPAFLGLALFALSASVSALAQPDLAPKPASRPTPDAQVSVKLPETALPKLELPKVARMLRREGEIRIVAFGSSSTAGTGASSPAATYPALLETDLEERLEAVAATAHSITVINRGKGGDDSEAMARRLERDVLNEHPDLVIWQTGSNDPLKGTPVERFKQLTREGIAAIRASGADVILMDQQWCSRLSGIDNARAYGDALHEVAAELQVPVIRRHAMMQSWVAKGLMTPTQMIGPDGLHMTDAGYRQLAKSAAAQILSGAGLTEPSLAHN